MGYGDQLVMLGEAWKRHRADPTRRVAIGDGTRLHLNAPDLAQGLDFLASEDDLARGLPVQWAIGWPRRYPYLDYEAMEAAQRRRWPWLRLFPSKHLGGKWPYWIFQRDFRPTPAPLRFSDAELALIAEWQQRRFVLVEPFIKSNAPAGKQWPVERYAAVAAALAPEIEVFQLSAPDSPELPGVPQIRPKSFRESLAYVRAARLLIAPEGGLVHGAAAVGTRAVVLFGGFNPPAVIGYPFHVPMTGGEPEPCGTKAPKVCPHCVAAMARISVEEVVAAARTALALPPVEGDWLDPRAVALAAARG